MKKNKKNQKNLLISLCICISVLFIHCCSIVSPNATNIYNSVSSDSSQSSLICSESMSDTLSKTSRTIAIINGNHMEYCLFHNEYLDAAMNNVISTRMKQEGLLYSFIMAKIYNDTIAAYDFCTMLEESDYGIDSGTIVFVIDFLEMVSKSKPDPLSFLASKKLYDIYLYGKYGVEKDINKADYFNNLCDTIANRIHF